MRRRPTPTPAETFQRRVRVRDIVTEAGRHKQMLIGGYGGRVNARETNAAHFGGPRVADRDRAFGHLAGIAPGDLDFYAFGWSGKAPLSGACLEAFRPEFAVFAAVAEGEAEETVLVTHHG